MNTNPDSITEAPPPKLKPGLRDPVTKHELRLARRQNELVSRRRHLVKELNRVDDDLRQHFYELIRAGMYVGEDGQIVTMERLEAEHAAELAKAEREAEAQPAAPSSEDAATQ